jgi:hypothetical protein
MTVLYFNPKNNDDSKNNVLLESIIYKKKIKEEKVINFYSMAIFPELHSSLLSEKDNEIWHKEYTEKILNAPEVIVIVPYWFDLFPSRFISFLHLMIAKTRGIGPLDWKIIISFDSKKENVNDLGIQYLKKLLPMITKQKANISYFFEISKMTNIDILQKVIKEI